ncbi:MAG: hypothetical protein ACM336_15205 [Acidobacteriota bacterium]
MRKHRLPPWVVLLCLAVICAALIAGVAVWRSNRSSAAALVSRLPSDGGAIVLSVDFAALRKAGVLGLLNSSRVRQEPEYRSFVNQTGFDYLNDLDAALVSFHSTGTYFLLRGRFDWKNLKDYTVHQGGTCYNTFCRVAGSTPERKISYFPLQPGMMALAVSRDESAAMQLQTHRAGRKFNIPDDPVWSLIPMAALKNSGQLPPGTRAFARLLADADTVVISAAVEDGRIGLRMDASCRSAAGAKTLAAQLTDATALLRNLIARENKAPNASDLSGVLAAGAFENRDTHVLGRWPLDRAFLENLAGNSL